MLQIFRNFFKSKVGITVTLAFLGLIAFAFASSDVANTGSFGGVTGGDRVAVVGDRRIDVADLSLRTSDTLNRVRQDNPTMTMEGFIANDGMQSTLDALISRAAIAELASLHGLRAGSRLVDSEIVNNPNLRSLDGSFDADAFRNLLRQQGINEEMFRDDLAMGLYAQQMADPMLAEPRLPEAVIRRYAQLRLETRNGSIAALMAGAFAPEDDPTEEQLQAFYDENSDNYIRPERRVVRYAVFGEEAFIDIPEPTEEQIAERYERDSLLYSDRETRSFTQLIALTEAAAQAIADEVNGGVGLEASARDKGLTTTAISPITQEDLAELASQAVAAAAFSTENGALSVPAQGDLGWYILQVDNVDEQQGRSLDEARDEIAAALAIEQRRFALNDATARIEDDFQDGRNLSEVAEELGVEISSTRPVTAVGQVYGTQETAPIELAPVLSFAFEIDEGEPQLSEAVPGETFIIYDVSDITRSAVAPMDEILDAVSNAWRADEAMKAAGEAASRVLERVEAGSTLADALGEEEADLPPVDTIQLSRAQVEAAGGISRPVALFFSMAEGTTKQLEAPENGAWFVLQLDEIEIPELESGSEIVVSTAGQLLPFLPDEYTEQFISAVEAEVEIDINQVAVDAVAAQLTGQLN